MDLNDHSAHHSHFITDYVKYMKGETSFRAAYSSRLNNCEHVWALVKRLWAKFVSRITVDYN